MKVIDHLHTKGFLKLQVEDDFGASHGRKIAGRFGNAKVVSFDNGKRLGRSLPTATRSGLCEGLT